MKCKMSGPLITAAPIQQNGSAPKKGAAKRPHGGKMHERARDRRGSRDIEGEECGGVPLNGIDVSIARSRGASSASEARWLRRTRQNAERRHRDTGGRKGYRVIRRGYPSIRRAETEVDLRLRGWGWIRIRPGRDSDANPNRFRKAIDAYPPDHPREVKHKK